MCGTAPGARAGALAIVLAAAALVADVWWPTSVPLVSPVELARWIRDARPGLDVIDSRDAVSFEAGHVATARNLPAGSFAKLAPERDATVVLYGESEETVTPLAATVSPDGSVDVYVLERGYDGWLDDVMAPRISDEASEAERAAFSEQAKLSRWFGGLPRVVPASVLEDQAAGPTVERPKRFLDGC
jgi:rhodanese-related sulfurtransferase